MSGVDMFRVTLNGRIIGTIRKSDLVNHGDMLARARYELAQMVDSRVMAECVLRGEATQYSDGSLTVRPMRKDRTQCRDSRNDRIVSYWFTPYVFNA